MTEKQSVVYRKLSDLVKLAHNPRTIKKEDMEKLMASIKKFGVLEGRPFLLSNRTGELVIIGGNMRYEACKKLKIEEVPTHLIEGLTEEDEREIIIRDNVSNGEWDMEMLANEWGDDPLEDWGVDVSFETVEPEAKEDDFEVDEGIKTDIVLGDLFEIGPHRLLCGDSTNIDDVNKLMNGEKADMVFTSPPYNANTKAGQGDIFNKKKSIKLYDGGYSDNLDSNKYIDFVVEVLNNCFLYTSGFIFWNVSYNANSRFEYIKQIYNHLDFLIEQICWKKSSTIPFKGSLMRDWEPIYLFSTNGEKLGLDKVVSNHWEISNTGSQQDNHKACFPIELPYKAIELVKKSNLILEPFCGSGTTMVASHQLNRKCYGMELDPKYVQTIVNRMIKLDPSIEVKRNGKPYSQSDF